MNEISKKKLQNQQTKFTDTQIITLKFSFIFNDLYFKAT